MKDVKVYFLYYFPIAMLVVIFFVGFITEYSKHMDTQEKLEQQESKIELLQLENASLHDSVWTLNQQLEKDNKE